VREISQALQVKPDFGQGWFMLCEFADAIGQQELNRFAGEQAVRLMPDNGRAWLRYGLALSRLEQDDEAIKAYRRAAELEPSLVKAWVNLCVTAKALGNYAESETFIRRAFEVSKTVIPDETAHEVDESEYNYLFWHLSLLELLTGRYREGFAHFRARFRGGTDWKRFESDKPLWRGEELRGKTILVTVEQGFGDALMLCRYLHWLKADGARVVFQVHTPLVPLFKNWPGADEVIPYGAAVTTVFDFHTAIFDLPHRFDTALETVPASVPYLPTPEPDDDTLLPDAGGLKVGIIWAGQPDNLRGKNRSIPLKIFADIFSIKGCQFFSLTRDKRPGETELLKQCPVTDLAPLLTGFAVTARFMNQMDLIISCDTATAHLAGGMGKKVWTLLPFVADWRWALEREDNVWYPTMRLFRQNRRDVWDDVVMRVKNALKEQNS
jgi:ADP-heptose:LPS heptosyltransferase